MSVVDLHPEELLDRDATGTLGEADRARLEAHLATCAACRFERAARRDFAAEVASPGDAFDHPDDLLDREARGTLGADERARLDAHLARCAACRFERSARVDFAAELRAPVEDVVPIAPAKKKKRRALVVPLLAAAALLVAGAAGAVGVIRVLDASPKQAVEPSAPATTPTDAPPPRRTAPLAPVPTETVPVETNAAPDVAAPAPSAAPALPPVASPIVDRAHATSTRETFAAIEPKRVEAPAPIEAPPPSAEAPRPESTPATVAALFAEANEARRRGEVDRAIQLYRQIEQRFPSSDEASVARANEARLLLDRGDAKGALDRYDAYLDGKGPLGEEALAGRARSLRRLGRANEEADAWAALLRAYPASPHAAEARARLAALGR